MLVLLLACLPPFPTDTAYVPGDSAFETDSGADTGTDYGTNDSGNPINDVDGDGYTTDDVDPSQRDCNDGDAATNPAASERLNFLDDNCDASMSERVDAMSGATGVTDVGTVGTLESFEVGVGNGRVAAGLTSTQRVALTPMSDFDDAILGNETETAMITRSNGVYFGITLTTGEFDGDGLPDALAGDPGDAGHSGVYVVLDGAQLSAGGTFDANSLPNIEENDALSRIGVAASQVGDSIAFTSVGPVTNSVYLLNGADVLSGSANTVNSGSVVVSGINYGGFGTALAGLDIDANGGIDLVIGAPTANPGGQREAGSVVAFSGGTLNSTGTTFDADDADIFITGAAADEQVGGRLLGMGDLDNDGRPDLLAANSGISGERNLWIIPGGLGDGTYTIDDIALSKITDIEVHLTEFDGFAAQGLASAPLDDVPGNELVAGAPGESPGVVYIFAAAALTGGGVVGVDAASAVITGTASNDLFGIALALGDGTGDGAADLAVSAPAASSGSVWFIPGSF